MEAPQTIYKQSATHFALPLYLRPDTVVDGRLVLDLAEAFLSTLLFPGCLPLALHTKRAGMGAKLNMGEFTSARWNTTTKKVLRGEYAVVHIKAETPDFPNQKIWLTIHVNPPGGAAYGYGNLAITLARPAFDPRLNRPPGARMPWEYIKPPEDRTHAVPVAYVGNDIEGNLSSLYCSGRGIKGAFWANFLSAAHVAMAGGEETLREKLREMRVECLNHGGLLVVATDSPLPDDTEATSERFAKLHDALQPAFLSREETPENKRGMLGYFYRERSYMV